MINITNYDLSLILQCSLNYSIKIEVISLQKNIVDVIYGVPQGGSSSINAESDIRRTLSFSIIPTLHNDLKIHEDGIIWLDKDIHLYIGLLDLRTGEFIYYSQGYYVFSNTSGTYDVTTNQLNINCNDFISKLDGTKNGQIGALTTVIPAYEENPETGEVIKYNIIRESMVQILTQMCGINDYIVDDIGEYKAMPDYNKNWEAYRKQNELWNTIPYDLEFSCGCTVLSILQTLRDLYPNYEMFFDENGIFKCQMVPSCYEDDIVFHNDFLQKIMISESTSLDMTTVRNMCEVWGQIIDANFFTENCSLLGNCYNCSIEGYDDDYYTGDTIAIRIPSTNPANAHLKVNGFNTIPIYDENTEEPLKSGLLEPNTVFVFKIKKQRIDGTDQIRAYYLGHWQAHGLNVLVDGSVSDQIYTTTDGTKLVLYSKEYFQKVFNCESVELTVIPDSPFTVQKLGQILDVKSGGEYDNITSDALALARARWENWKNSRLTDSISITTILVPFYDVNIKCSYKRSDSDIEEQYIIKSVSHDFSSGTSTLTLMKFYPLYET